MKNKFYLLAISTLLFQSSCITQITPQEEGFKVSNSGDYRGIDSLPLLTGYNGYLPGFTYIVSFPTTMQHVVWSESKTEGATENQEIVINCMGGSGFKVDAGLNYRIKPGKAFKIYMKYKTDELDKISDTYLRNIVRGAMQDISGYMTVDSMLNSLPLYESAVRTSLTNRFDKEGFILDNFNILALPRPVDPNLAAAINQKIIAKQQVETSKQQLGISINEANKKIAAARGDSAEAVIKAQGEAQAIKVKQLSLTPEYIEYIKWSNWDGKLPQTMLGSSNGIILNATK